MALFAVLAGFRNFILVICRPVLQIVHREVNWLGLAGYVVRRQSIGTSEIQLSQAFRLGQELPAMHLAIDSRVKDNAKNSKDDNRSR